MVLDQFSAPVVEWFTTSFDHPTPAQSKGWPAIASGEHTLILAPTGSGKTLAAFLWGLDRLSAEPVPEKAQRTRLLYISPLRALAVDVEKNLRAPLSGIRLAAERSGTPIHTPTVGMRTGDTATDERRRLVRTPPDLLITTPESLYLMLTSKARETLTNVQAVIIDEIHALAPTKRGAHLSLTLERLEAITDRPPQRIGLSATQRPLDEIARFLGGRDDGGLRAVTVVDAGIRKELDIEVVVPVEDMGALGEVIDEPGVSTPARRSIWPAMHPRLLELVLEHRSTLIFVNARRLAERLATRLNELALEGENHAAEAEGRPPPPGQELVKAHHGSLSRERRLQIEDELKRGDLKGLVATSSLELGIDMGAVDLVIQVESPGAVSRGLQRIGRAGHRVGEPSRGRLFPKHRADLVEAAVVVQRMHDGEIEHTAYPRQPLDVLAQQIVAMCALDDWPLDELTRLVRRSANFADLSDDVLHNVLDLLAGRYPSDEFAELRPRIVWDRVGNTVRGRAGAQRLAVTSGGTIPDRGLFGVFLPDGTRVGELDEEMVYESRPGETFLLGASTWRIQEITHERVIVTPAPGEPGKMPFWHGDGPGRPLELGRAVGQFVREIRAAGPDAIDRLTTRHDLDPSAARNLMAYLQEQAESTGAVPDDRTIVVEKFRDAIGDWRVCVLSPLGAQVHAPWAMALQARLGEQWGYDVELMWSDDGIVIRLPEAVDDLPAEAISIDPDEIEELIMSQLPSSAMFAARFRECAARALLLPRRRPGQRTPLWQQRQRAADLLRVAAKYPTFPILLETTRECLNDVFDVPALKQVLTDIRSRRIRVVEVETAHSSPFAQSLLFGWIAVYMYAGDAPLAERRAAALALDRDLLRDLLGAEELRELIDAEVLADLELELQRLTDTRAARDADEVHDLLRLLGPLNRFEIEARMAVGTVDQLDAWLGRLTSELRVLAVTIDGEERYAAAEDAGRLRDGLGLAVPLGLPAAFVEATDDPLFELSARYARTHGPFLTAQLARRFGVGIDRFVPELTRLEAEGRIVRGEFRPGGVEREWCDSDVLRALRRRSLAALRREVEPVEGDALTRFLTRWQLVASTRRDPDALYEIVAQLQGAALPASVLEADILPSRLADYRPADLDALCTSGEVVWIGAGAVGSNDGRIQLMFRDQAALLSSVPADQPPDDPTHLALRRHLADRGASFWPDLIRAVAAAELPYDDDTVLTALWDLVWAGQVTNDTLAPLRALTGRRRGGRGGAARGSARRSRRPGRPGISGRSRRPAPNSLTAQGPPSAAGRWALVAPLLVPSPQPTEAAHARALQLLERYGIVTREAALGEGAEGGFAGVYPVFKALEDRGQLRRGYFVAGLGAAQFALPGAVDRLRDHRNPTEAELEPIVLAATDPAQPFGAALPWPNSVGRPARATGAFVVLAAGVPLAYLEKGGRSLVMFDTAGDDPRWAERLVDLVQRRRFTSLEIARIDGASVLESPHAEALRAAGFVDSYRGLVHRGRR